jgi:hypothetical protein
LGLSKDFWLLQLEKPWLVPTIQTKISQDIDAMYPAIVLSLYCMENLVIHIFQVGMLQELQYKSINRPRHTLFLAVHPIFIYLAITHQFPLFDENLPRYLST